MRTNLPAWSTLRTGDKFSIALRELCLPSVWSVRGCPALLLWPIIHIVACQLLMIPFVIPMAIVMSLDAGIFGQLVVVVLAFLGPLVYPFLLVRRLRRMIRESNETILPGAMPTWK